MTATYALGTNAPASIAGGVFDKPADYEIKVTPTSISEVGLYTIALKIEDPLGLSAESSFSVSITNTAPTWSAIPP